MKRSLFRFFALLVMVALVAAPASARTSLQAQTDPDGSSLGAPFADDEAAPEISHRLIVQLQSPPLAQHAKSSNLLAPGTGRLDIQLPQAQDYLAQLQAEQAAFVSTLRTALPEATVGTFFNELGQAEELSFKVVFNGLVIDPGGTPMQEASRILRDLPGVRAVYLDYAHQADLYASVPLINAPTLWSHPDIGGMDNAGAGMKIASMDGGIHKDAPMFSGEGYTYPPGYPVGGLGLTANNNGKIIASRVYFRTWDPPIPEDANPWPGPGATSHGVHTSGIMGGRQVEADFIGITETISGVAPQAWLMSYRVFYNSVSGDGSFYTAEGLAALEDIAADGPDVLNNSWGGGPSSLGGLFDPLDQALVNVANSGVFVSMSAGNAGPGAGTGDHPSPEYINVAATTTTGTLAAGRLSVSAPPPVPETLVDVPFTAAGSLPDPGGVYPFDLVAGVTISATNEYGCNPWTGVDFAGAALLVSRGPEAGACSFTVKALNAQDAGAGAVIVYNHATGGDTLLNMLIEPSVTIPAFFIFRSTGLAMVDWYDMHGSAAEVTFDFQAFQAGNVPDVVIDFSSRGPGVGYVAKPDIAAPGVNILSQGFDPVETGEAEHLGFGQVSGTSMAAPHVSGAAALVRQVHPDWSNEQIKSALMTTSKYIGIFNEDGTHAGPLDMGAGRLDLTNAAEPGVFISPPNVGFGLLTAGMTETITLTVSSAFSGTETYLLSTVMITSTNFMTPTVSPHPHFTVSPSSLTLGAGVSETIQVTITGMPGLPGDYQGYVVLDGTTHDAHFPVWGRVAPEPNADVLIIDLDFSPLDPAFPDYLSYYTDALDELGYTYDVFDALANVTGDDPILPHAAVLSSYPAIVLFTGDNFLSNGTFTVPTPLTGFDMNRLTEYANGGGILVVMGQDLASVANSVPPVSASFFYDFVLGGSWLQDSVTGGMTLPDLPVVGLIEAPEAFRDIALDLSGGGDGAANQFFIDEIDAEPSNDPDFEDEIYNPYIPILRYPAPTGLVEDGIVGMLHRDQPTLERPGVSYDGRSVYTTFGLEGVNNTPDHTTRAGLLGTFLDWAMDEPTVTITDTTTFNTANLSTFEVSLTSEISGTTGVLYRWDFGDGTEFTPYYDTNVAGHAYEQCGTYTVRVEAVDSLGNHAIGMLTVNVTMCGENRFPYRLLFPVVFGAGNTNP